MKSLQRIKHKIVAEKLPEVQEYKFKTMEERDSFFRKWEKKQKKLIKYRAAGNTSGIGKF